ncbi:type III R-M system restriction endonuclease [Moorella thermoacetica Y72]|uniref:Type III R-M system restriction endonuclease n=1 Tax=Moorella thermoacetica Y72 TaxID=1325331 RepID=A0A0S6UFX2_NEOTH|nr:DEAD/DEAH box helicase family protein [Moorella thermoacetica]GAF26364.1 type III R-M system restriction endonuclease [Moorella thermoacetica Y72]
MAATIDKLIINSPYEKPARHWSYNREKREFILKEGRRPAGYIVASRASKSFDDPGIFIELPLVNKIRPRVDAWREQGYPGVTGITRKLLEHWHDPEERQHQRFFFCQLEAIETLIWLIEAPAASKQGIEIPDDGGEFRRLCSKMATGSGKTIVMAMLIAWQVLNKVTYPQDTRFSKNVLIVAPGLTVKSRLQVLNPAAPNNYYQEFNIVPSSLFDKLRQGKIMIINWHRMKPIDEKAGPKVIKKGPESDEAFVRRVLGDMATARNIIVINDEAHHAWRVPAESKIKGVSKEELDRATIWVEGLDRIHRKRGILYCFDFSATPFSPSGKKNYEEALFGWIVSDFGLNDAIEAGLVKTPRVVIRDDGTLTSDLKSRFYHIYMDDEVKDDLNRKANPEEPLPDLVTNAYYFLGLDWLETYKLWQQAGIKTPPVMITVCNRTETAARIEHAFNQGKIKIDELKAPDKTLRIDSKVLEEAESRVDLEDTGSLLFEEEDKDDEKQKKVSKKDQAELLRQMVDTVGKVGKPGEKIQNVIAVAMLSEGWDAKTVTHIMGLRAFSSQLLCEQVVGRGLRRTSYEVDPETGLFEPEYVNIFGVPFTFMPHEGGDGTPPPPPKPRTCIEPVPEKRQYEIKWPNIIRIERVFRPVLSLDWSKVQVLELKPEETPTLAEMAPIIDGKPDVSKITQIDLEELGKKFRLQKIIFETARDIYDQMKPGWHGNKEFLLIQLIKLVEQFINSDKISIPTLYHQQELRRRILITLNMNKIIQHIFDAIKYENTVSLELVFDTEKPIRSTGDMMTWYTSKPCEVTRKSHISHAVFDSTWEASEAFEFDRPENDDKIDAWVKNDHLGFEILYIYKGVVRKYRPDYLIRFKNGNMLVLEVKGQDNEQSRAKREALKEWVMAVNAHGGFGTWFADVSYSINDIKDIIAKYSSLNL